MADALTKEGDPSKEGDPPKESEPPAEIDPASYTFELPETIAADDPLLAAFREAAAGAKLGQEAAAAIVNKLAPQLAEQLTAPQRAWNQLQAEWQQQARTHPDIGGDNFDPMVARVTGLLRTFGHPDLPMALTMTGMGNNPAMLWTLNALALRLGEGAPVQGGTPPGQGARHPAAALYPSASDAGTN